MLIAFVLFSCRCELMRLYRIEESVREDLAILEDSPLIKKGTQFVGLKFDTDSGKLSFVEQ